MGSGHCRFELVAAVVLQQQPGRPGALDIEAQAGVFADRRVQLEAGQALAVRVLQLGMVEEELGNTA